MFCNTRSAADTCGAVFVHVAVARVYTSFSGNSFPRVYTGVEMKYNWQGVADISTPYETRNQSCLIVSCVKSFSIEMLIIIITLH